MIDRVFEQGLISPLFYSNVFFSVVLTASQGKEKRDGTRRAPAESGVQATGPDRPAAILEVLRPQTGHGEMWAVMGASF